MLNYLNDKSFLLNLDREHLKEVYAKITVLDKDERPLEDIMGRISSGSINIDGSSNVRRTCNLTFVAYEEDNNLTNIDNLLSINKKIKVAVGVRNRLNEIYPDIIWFPQGIFVIISPSISHSVSGVTISLSCKDKMCLLNGECGGGLPTSVTFDSYDQINEDGTVTTIKQKIFDIIQTLVCNFGGEQISKIFISDIEEQIKQIVRNTSSSPIYHNVKSGQYTTDATQITPAESNNWSTYSYNEDVGYVYTDFVYPGSLVSNIGENVCSVLDKIKNTLGNFEYFYDVNGNFIFQEIKNYLNHSYAPAENTRLSDYQKTNTAATANYYTLLDEDNYYMDVKSNSKSVYTFAEGDGLVISFSNSPQFSSVKNDFHVWGKSQSGFAIHYHLAIKAKPKEMNTYQVTYLKDKYGDYTGGIKLTEANDDVEDINAHYIPKDWRAELYLQGLVKKMHGIRPNVYEQELLDLFDSIYNFKEESFKVDLTHNPNDLLYWFDYLEPANEIYDISIDSIGARVHSYQQDKIVKMYNLDIPNYIILKQIGSSDRTTEEMEENIKAQKRCKLEGQAFANVDNAVYSSIAIGTIGYTAQEVMRDILYQNIGYNESISLSTIPIYYLEPNNRISVYDRASNIYGDYIIKSISLQLGASGSMSISATRAQERI